MKSTASCLCCKLMLPFYRLSGPHKCNTTTVLQYKTFFLVLQLYCTCADRVTEMGMETVVYAEMDEDEDDLETSCGDRGGDGD